MKKNVLICLVLAITMSAFAQKAQRVILWEHFTQASCGYCPAGNTWVDNLAEANPTKVVRLKYQVSWPGFDPMNLHNPSEVATRVSYYGVSGVPHTCLDGNVATGDYNNVTQAVINTRSAVASPYTIDLSHAIVNDSIYVTMNITADQVVTGNIVAQIAVVEQTISFPTPPGSNGEKEFVHVMKKMLPNAQGTAVTALTVGAQQQFVYKWKYANVYDVHQLAVVAFIQNNSTKEVLQAAYSEPIIENDYDIAISSIFSLNTNNKICLNSFIPKITIKNYGYETITSCDISYQINNETPKTYAWTGSISTLKSQDITLDEISFTLLENNALTVVVSNPNGHDDEDMSSNTKVLEFNKSSVTPSNLSLIIKPDAYGSEISWKLYNSNNQIVLSGGPYTDGQTSPIFIPLAITTPDCYRFVMYDNYGDGIASPGYYTLISENGESLVEPRSGSWLTEENQFEVTTINAPLIPTLTSTPTNGSVGFPLADNILLKFSSSLRFADNSVITTVLFKNYVKLLKNSTSVSYIITIDKSFSLFTLNPTSNLTNGEIYTLEISEGLETFFDVPFPATSFSFTAGTPTDIPVITDKTTIYPNPFNSLLNIDLDNQQYSTIKIYDVNGVIVYSNSSISSKKLAINTSDFNQGMYFVQISTNKETTVQKVVLIK